MSKINYISNGVKKLAPLFLIVFVAGLFLPLTIFAAGGSYPGCQGKIDDQGNCGGTTVTSVCYQGIVPCGKEVLVGGTWDEDKDKCIGGTPKVVHCQLCHFFLMIDGIIDYVLISIVPPITVLMLVIGGVMFYFGGAKPDLLSKSKTLFKSVVIGLVLIYGAYMIVGIVLSLLGTADINPISSAFDKDNGVFRINCPIELPR